ncbi:hypothetical protein C9J03_21625 [Photobacterium gaetbulicola]|uniref:ATPase involved in DNA repair n=1 Tax=Photobacterium gaetbulicola Gung47 TaxID=658445 RepID=A0A0C5WS26_9GAMM|nr:hypothetical protein [Photobacterium gaetbulicola]AJR07889.1 hypothetical protein H744_2c1210 [Photobacterium gaetbulicola Gung47]PSU03162.1 hypothetical protein C9J03_21625 [Photobacterium gaetbulicola]
MKKGLTLTAIAVTVLLSGCASDSEATKALPLDSNQSGVSTQIHSIAHSLRQAEDKRDSAKEDELQWFATKYYQDADKALSDAKEYYAVFETDPGKAHSSTGFFSSRTNIQAAEEALNQFNLNIAKAEIIREKALSVLDEAFSYRAQLQSLDVDKYYPKSNARLESQLKTLVNHIADERTERATSGQPDLVSKQRALEVKTVTRIYLSAAQKELARLKNSNIALHAPDTLAVASTRVTAAEAFIAAEPRSFGKIEHKADEAMFSLNHAEHIADVVQKLKALPEKDYERHVLTFEKMLVNIAKALGSEDLRDNPISEQGKLLVSLIEAQKAQSSEGAQNLEQLLAQLTDEQQKVAELEASLAAQHKATEHADQTVAQLEAKIAELNASLVAAYTQTGEPIKTTPLTQTKAPKIAGSTADVDQGSDQAPLAEAEVIDTQATSPKLNAEVESVPAG